MKLTFVSYDKFSFDGSQMPEGFSYDGSNMPSGDSDKEDKKPSDRGFPGGGSGFSPGSMPEGNGFGGSMPEGGFDFDSGSKPDMSGFGSGEGERPEMDFSPSDMGGSSSKDDDSKTQGRPEMGGFSFDGTDGPPGGTWPGGGEMGSGMSFGSFNRNGVSKLGNLLSYGICLIVMLAGLLVLKHYKRIR